jgi:hypothetical protein
MKNEHRRFTRNPTYLAVQKLVGDQVSDDDDPPPGKRAHQRTEAVFEG